MEKTIQLQRRMENNFEDFERNMLDMCKECIFQSAAEIALYREVQSYVSEYDWTSESVAELLLRFETPC